MDQNMAYLFFVSMIAIGEILMFGGKTTEDKLSSLIVMILGVVNIITMKSPYLGG
jgi:hypothetical protein